MGANKRWERLFLAALTECGVILHAARAAGVDRSCVWRLRKANPEFDQSCRDAIDNAIDTLEAEAIRRARDGIKEDVYYKGEVVGQRIVYSDQLLMALLKGRRREIYGDRVEHAGAAGAPIQYVVVTAVPQPDHSELA